MSEFFNVEKIYYEGAKSKNPFAFKHYNLNEKIGKSTMRKQLRFALEVLRAGGFVNGGLNFDAKPRRASMTEEDIFLSYIAGMDCFALGLKIAYKIIEDGRIDSFVKERYSSFTYGIGEKIVNGTATLEELSDYALKADVVTERNSGRQEYLESIINDIMFGA